MFISYLLIGIILWFIIKIYISVRDAKRRANDLFGQFGARTAEGSRERKAGWSSMSAPKRKKIDSSIGEYVAFEEISDTKGSAASSSDGGRTDTGIEVEQQVTDVEWEDIK
ncbi:MAG: DUF4834 family protein [Muribaculaceae bacterium]|nr:DUF4834 family protein [Muribaculaceae bacterium]